MADPKTIRRYHAGVERALALFDSTNEWADYIAFLSRLLKALQESPPEADIPFKDTIAKHLAQCLKPTLPSGVHQKALEVYELIFSILGGRGLAQDITLYLPGISHTLTFASLSTRPQVLSIYDNYILALSVQTLRPALRSLILSLLPAIEEDSSEDFDQVLTTFDSLRTKFAQQRLEEIFWQNLFLASTTCPHRRAGILVYLNRFLPSLASKSAEVSGQTNNVTPPVTVATVTSPEPGLLVRCFATGLQDEQSLVQRGFLDLLVTHLPLDAEIFSHQSNCKDVDVLVRAATTVVLRRDMSLNRRLWMWLLGSEAKALSSGIDEDRSTVTSPTISKPDMHATQYFTHFAIQPLVRGFREILSNLADDPVSRARPFRIALSLMDRGEIGGPFIEAVFVSLLRTLQQYQSSAPSQDAFDEVFRSANTFFDGVEGRLIAGQLIRLILDDDLDLVIFLVTSFNLEDDEMMKRHIPLICLFIADQLRKVISVQHWIEDEGQIDAVIKLVQLLLELLGIVAINVLDDSGAQVDGGLRTTWHSQVLRYYEQDMQSTKSIMMPLSRPEMTVILVELVYECVLQCLSDSTTDSRVLNDLSLCAERCITLSDGCATIRRIGFMNRVLVSLRSDPSDQPLRQFQVAISLSRIIEALRTNDHEEQVLSTEVLVKAVIIITRKLWSLLDAALPQFHVEAVESIWRLHSLVRDTRLMESTLLSLISDYSSDGSQVDRNVLRFSAVWTHSKSVSKTVLTLRQQRESEDNALEILAPSLLFYIDDFDRQNMSDAFSNWIHSLNSLDFAFDLVLDNSLVHSEDEENLAIMLERISKLVFIAKHNAPLWARVSSEKGQATALVDLCRSILTRRPFSEPLAVEALSIVEFMVQNRCSIEADGFLHQLMDLLASTHSQQKLQRALLGTLQLMLSETQLQDDVDSVIPALLEGMVTPHSDPLIDKWVTLLCNIIPSLSATALMTNLLRMTECLCKLIVEYSSIIQNLYGSAHEGHDLRVTHTRRTAVHPDRSLSNLLAGTEYLLARAHQHVNAKTERDTVKVNGSHADVPSGRSVANEQLTVILCMQDALKTCTALWQWRPVLKPSVNAMDTKSLHYMSSKLRTRSRRFLENLIDAEPQECLETFMGLWIERRKSDNIPTQILELLQTLDGARPKFMMPATFNAIYNRTNPAALDNSQRSTLSVTMNTSELIAFLNEYTDALEDDLIDEIWADCSNFLKEVLSNPLPHRQILPKLLEFIAVLCRKMENTNFGEESRTRRELADICTRLFTAIFTVKAGGSEGLGSKLLDIDTVFSGRRAPFDPQLRSGNTLQLLQQTLPDVTTVLNQSDRLLSIYHGIATNITGPLLRSKTFPQNVTPELLALLQTMSAAPSATRAWKKDVTDAFSDVRFFQNSVQLVSLGWLPLIRQLALVDKLIMPELVSRLTTPAVAGLMFGVGAAAARTEADRRTQATLRRIALLLLSADVDMFVPQLQPLLLKLEELFTATPESSPSSAIKSDVYLVLRTILLTVTQSQLFSLWPLIDTELRDLCTDMLSPSQTKLTTLTKLQGAKLLDLLLLLKPDEFQLHEWLFVTDTVDAIYPPSDTTMTTTTPTAFADRIGAAASSSTTTTEHGRLELTRTNTSGSAMAAQMKRPWLCSDASRDASRTEALLGEFFGQLSIRAFEDNYSLRRVDMGACRGDLIADLLVDG